MENRISQMSPIEVEMTIGGTALFSAAGDAIRTAVEATAEAVAGAVADAVDSIKGKEPTNCACTVFG